MLRKLFLFFEKNQIPERGIPDKSCSDVIQTLSGLYEFVLPWAKNKNVLDIACGVGYGSNKLITKGHAKKVVGIDICSKAIDYANKHYQCPNLEFRIGDAQQIDLLDNCFDLVVSIETIEHLKKRNKFLKHITRVLKPDGILILSTPNKAATIRSQLVLKPINKYHITEFRKNRLERLLKKYFTSLEWFGQVIIPKKSFIYFFKRIFWILKRVSPVHGQKDYKILPYPSDPKLDVCTFVVVCHNLKK